jgi:hypothetical protein
MASEAGSGSARVAARPGQQARRAMAAEYAEQDLSQSGPRDAHLANNRARMGGTSPTHSLSTCEFSFIADT